jgi:hypothetical protein
MGNSGFRLSALFRVQRIRSVPRLGGLLSNQLVAAGVF